MLNKYHSENNKTFTYNRRSLGIFPKVPGQMVDNLLLLKYLSTHKNKVEKLQFIKYLTTVNETNMQSPFWE